MPIPPIWALSSSRPTPSPIWRRPSPTSGISPATSCWPRPASSSLRWRLLRASEPRRPPLEPAGGFEGEIGVGQGGGDLVGGSVDDFDAVAAEFGGQAAAFAAGAFGGG